MRQIIQGLLDEADYKELCDDLLELTAEAKKEGTDGLYQDILDTEELTPILVFAAGCSVILQDTGLDPKLASVLERFARSGKYLLDYCREKSVEQEA